MFSFLQCRPSGLLECGETRPRKILGNFDRASTAHRERKDKQHAQRQRHRHTTTLFLQRNY
jgi:hypothetical protein